MDQVHQEDVYQEDPQDQEVEVDPQEVEVEDPQEEVEDPQEEDNNQTTANLLARNHRS